MPRYGYHCQNCGKKFRKFLTYEEYGKVEVHCPYCQSTRLKRLIDRVRFAKSEESRLEALESTFSDPAALAGLEDDPQAMGRMMRMMSREMGEDLGPEFEEVVERLERGQSPEEIEKELPDLGEELGSGLGGMDDIEDF